VRTYRNHEEETMNAKILLALLATLSLSSVVALGQQAATPAVSYESINLGTPLGGTFATGQGVSVGGFVAGYSTLPGDATQHVVLWLPNGTKDLGTFGGPSSVLSAFFDIQQALPAVWQNGKVSTLPLPAGDSNGSAYASNDIGQIVGTSGDCVSNPNARALLWQNGHITNLGNLGGASFNQPAAINNLGQITGGSDLPGDQIQHAFLWQNGVMTDLGTLPGDTFSFGTSINNLGQIVGYSCDVNFNCRAVLWQNGSIVDLNTLNPSGSSLFLNYAGAIDDLGVIAGYAFDQSTNTSPAFVSIPRLGGFAQAPRTEAVPRVAMPDRLRTLVQQKMRIRGARWIGPTVGDSQK
jgi:probable HAF family extracellular repeat protein